MQRHELGSSLTHGRIEPLEHDALRRFFSRIRPRTPATQQATRLVAKRGLADLLDVGGHPRQLAHDHPGAARQDVRVARGPGRTDAIEGDALRLGQALRHGVQQRVLLQPAARERIERQHAPRDRGARGIELALPAARDLDLARGVHAGAELVQQHQRGLAQPFEDAQLRGYVARDRGILRRVGDVEHDVGSIARGAHRLLTAPERPIGEPVPQLRQEPADRLAALLEATQQSHAVAEPRRVPQHELVSAFRPQEHMGLGRLGHVRAVHDRTDVLAQQRARQRGLARIRVRQQRDLDALLAHAGTGRAAARRRATTSPGTGCAPCSAARSTGHTS